MNDKLQCLDLMLEAVKSLRRKSKARKVKKLAMEAGTGERIKSRERQAGGWEEL